MTGPITFPTIQPPQFVHPPNASGGLSDLAHMLLTAQAQQTTQQENAARTHAESVRNLIGLLSTVGPSAAAQEPSLEPIFASAGVQQAPMAAAAKQRSEAGNLELETFFKSLPPELARAQRAAFTALNLGAGKEQAGQIASTLMEASATPETIAVSDRDFPEFRALPTKEKLIAFTHMRGLQAEARLQLGPEGQRQVQRGLDDMRKQEIELRKGLLGLQTKRLKNELGQPDAQTMRATLSYLQLVDRGMNDLFLTKPELLGQPAEDQIRGLFGPAGLAAWRNARGFLERAIPPNPAQKGAPPEPPASKAPPPHQRGFLDKLLGRP